MILVNGVPTDMLPAADRGLMYGDGVFRTLLLRAGRPLCWRQHYAKLQADCAALDISCPALATLTGEIAQVAAEEPDCAAKIIVTRGLGARGYLPSAASKPSHLVISAAVPGYPAHYREEGVALHVCELRLAQQPRLAGIKHLNRLENVLARMEWSDPAIAEGLLLDAQGCVIEGTMSNVFMLKNGTLHTPDLHRCGVAGVTRERVMAAAPRLGLQARGGDYDLEFLLDAEEVLLCNSLIGVWQVRACRGAKWRPGGLAPRLRAMLGEEEA